MGDVGLTVEMGEIPVSSLAGHGNFADFGQNSWILVGFCECSAVFLLVISRKLLWF